MEEKKNFRKKKKQARRSEESLLSTATTEESSFPVKPHTKSVSLPPSPNIASILSFVPSSECQKCPIDDEDGLVVKVKSEDEKRLLTTIRDELRTSPVLKVLLQAKLNKESERA